MQEEYVQQKMGDNKRKCQSRSNGMYQQKDKLDMEIDEIWMLIMRVLTRIPKRRNTKVIRKTNNTVQLTVRRCINKASGQQKHKI